MGRDGSARWAGNQDPRAGAGWVAVHRLLGHAHDREALGRGGGEGREVGAAVGAGREGPERPPLGRSSWGG